MQIIVQLAGAGWADGTISDGNQTLTMAISYIGDGIAEMAKAAVQLLRGERSAVFAFQEEPGEHVVVLTRGADDELQIEVFKNFKNFKGPKGQPIMTMKCSILDFVGQVFWNLHSIKVKEGDRYKERWRYDFPTADFEFLRKSL